MNKYPIILDAQSVLEILDLGKGVLNQAVNPQPQDFSYDADFPYDWRLPNASRKRDITYDGDGPSKKDLWFDSPEEVLEFLREFEECPYGKPGDLLWVKEAWGYIGTMVKVGGNGRDEHTASVRYLADGERQNVIFGSAKQMYESTPDQKLKYPKGYEELDELERMDIHDELLNKWWKKQKKKQARWMPEWASRIYLRVNSVEPKRLDNGLFVWAIDFERIEV